MANNFFKIQKKIDNFNKISKSLKWLKKNSVYVGIPEDKSKRKNEEKNSEITNAELLFIHTNGSPVNNIPPRPVIEPAIQDDKDRLTSMLKKAAKLVIDGKEDEALKQLKMVGMRGQNVSKNWFTSEKNNWPSNSPSVKREKEKKGSTNPRPLIDTGELRNSITYIIKSEKR